MQNKSKTGHQIKALILKNLHLQKRQPCTNCCQIFTPIICLLLTIVIRNVAIANIPNSNDTIYGIYPLLAAKFNDYSLIDQAEDYVLREKVQYYLFDVANPAHRDFVGTHDGKDFNKNLGLLGAIPNTYSTYEPYFTSLNDWLEWRIPPQFEFSNRTIEQ